MNDYTDRNLHKRAAEYYRSVHNTSKPVSLADLEPQLLEFEHLVMAQDYDTAASLMGEIGEKYLALWGYLDRITNMRSKLIERLSDPKLEAENLISLADAYRMMGQTSKAIIYGEKALQFAEKANDKTHQGKCFILLGGTYRRIGETTKSIDYLKKSLIFSQELLDPNMELQASHQLAMALTFVGRMEESATMLQHALSLSKQINNLKMQGEIQGQLGYTTLWLGNLTETIQYFTNALKIAESVENKRGQGYWYLALGEGYLVQRKFIESKEAFKMALHVAEEIADNHLKNYAGCFLAEALLKSGHLQEALSVIVQARKFDNPQHNDYVVMILGIILAKLNNSDAEAKQALVDALNLSNDLLQKTPDLLEAKCTKGVVLLTLALLGPLNNQTISYLVQSKSVFDTAFQNTLADGVVMRYKDIVDELKPLDKMGLITLVFNEIGTMTNNIKKTGLFIELHINSFDIAVDFYTKLGFIVVQNTSGKNDYLTMRREKSVINFYRNEDLTPEHPYFSQFSKSTPLGYGVELIIPVEDIEDVYLNIKNNIPSKYLLEKLIKQVWGKKDFRIVDPFGFYIRFTEPINWLKS